MKTSILYLLIVALITVLTACTPRIYGVPQEQWEVMSENERIAAMDAYKERQIAYQRAATERARIRAEQEAARQSRLEAEMQRRHERANLIYRGRAGTFGDLIEITLHQGQMRLNYNKRPYSPVTFKLADGEIKSIPIHFTNGHRAGLWVLYENRNLWLDIDPYNLKTQHGAHLVYNDDWSSGVTYTGINSHGSRDLRGINVDIDVVPHRRGRKYAGQKPIVIVREKIVEKPVKVAHEKDHQRSRKGHSTNRKITRNKFSTPEQTERSETRREVSIKKKDKPASRKAVPIEKRLHVKLNGGKILVDGKHRPFRPIDFEIGEGETRTIILTGKGGKIGPFRQEAKVSCHGGRIYLDGQPLDESAEKNHVEGRKKKTDHYRNKSRFRGVKASIESIN